MTSEQGKLLLEIAREEIERAFGELLARPTDEPWLHERRATFVTLRQGKELRGCIGSTEPRTSLLEDLQKNARLAAFRDPRFPPLAKNELAQINIEVSVLSPLEPIECLDEKGALEKLRPKIDGVVFEHGVSKSTFLPQVWEDLIEPQEFLAQLKIKAGLTRDFWSQNVKLYRYTVHKWGERDF